MRISDWSSDVCSSDLSADTRAAVVDGDRLGADRHQFRQLRQTGDQASFQLRLEGDGPVSGTDGMPAPDMPGAGQGDDACVKLHAQDFDRGRIDGRSPPTAQSERTVPVNPFA